MDSFVEITPFRKRRYEKIPVDKVKVMNSRNRDADQFQMNVESIGELGLQKPIRVNDKFLKRSGFYELICGEGRLLAHKEQKLETIKAEVVTCTRKGAHLQSLIENIARIKPGSMDYARELKRLHDEKWSCREIARIACRSETYVKDLIRLVENGEDRLIYGVEQGVFSMSFAMQVASADTSQLQNLLMDAFDAGLVTTMNFAQARKIITARVKGIRPRKVARAYTVDQLKHDIVDATKAKASYVREAQGKENRFMALLSGINDLWRDKEFQELLYTEKLQERPDLAGDFGYESS